MLNGAWFNLIFRKQINLKQPFLSEQRHCWLAYLPEYRNLSDTLSDRRSPVNLYENGRLLGPAHSMHDVIRQNGKGAFSHWYVHLYFSTSDNSDPNTNGRTYSISSPSIAKKKLREVLSPDRWRMNAALSVYEKKRKLILRFNKILGLKKPRNKGAEDHGAIFPLSREHFEVWQRHPAAHFLIAHGGNEIPPPLSCNIAVTTRCNLKCTICGAQNSAGHVSRDMPIETFQKIAETLFPVITQVELNSQGEPLLHPQIKEILSLIKRYDCYVALQTNATQFTLPKIELLSGQAGDLQLSIDATGAIFNDIRRGADWVAVDKMVKQLMKKIDTEKLRIWVTPTINRRTLGCMRDLLEWAADRNVFGVTFHRLDPSMYLPEIRPYEGEWANAVKRIEQWVSKNEDAPVVVIEGRYLKRSKKRREDLKEKKRSALSNFLVNPKEVSGEIKKFVCAVPFQYLEIGLDGEIYLCCKNQRSPVLGQATSVEAFAEAWFGPTLRSIRESLMTNFKGVRPVKMCDECIRNHNT